ncbi:hypothetical protein [Actinoplanes couchii]|uniref:Uncharacterized protein n=1 Tax=Actinoplanes couchii TaxID=403638 RepID=A0ABQ3XTH1_9ACTN|nr:hypothetical protein [Actinoplanes couchii]MDR6319946.1 hypothetical protein [Actinoplanes couchii]GID61672.1 hypothetical protein Aco03nite_100760 [Actinoplanes couchii]
MPGPVSGPVTRRAAGVAAVAAVVLLLAGCAGETSAELTGYRTGPGDREITVSYIRGEGDPSGHLTILEESPGQVRVRVTYPASDDTVRTLIGIGDEATARLAEPLADREILDDRGDSVRRLP